MLPACICFPLIQSHHLLPPADFSVAVLVGGNFLLCKDFSFCSFPTQLSFKPLIQSNKKRKKEQVLLKNVDHKNDGFNSDRIHCTFQPYLSKYRAKLTFWFPHPLSQALWSFSRKKRYFSVTSATFVSKSTNNQRLSRSWGAIEQTASARKKIFFSIPLAASPPATQTGPGRSPRGL